MLLISIIYSHVCCEHQFNKGLIIIVINTININVIIIIITAIIISIAILTRVF